MAKKIDIYNAGKEAGLTGQGEHNYAYGSWQYKAWIDGWQAGKDEAVVPKANIARAFETKRERDMRKRAEGFARVHAHKLRMAQFDKEARAARTPRGNRAKLDIWSPNIKKKEAGKHAR